MAYLSRIVTAGIGSVYTITIPYLERTHVTCFVNDIARTFVWDTDTQITLDGLAPGGGDTVEIIRNTPDNLVQFQDGSTLDETLLNVFDLVHQYQNEEFLEDVRTEELDMGSNKIVNVTDPTLAQDAATKAYADSVDAANSVTDQAYADTVALEGGVPGVSQAFRFYTSAGDTIVSAGGLFIDYNAAQLHVGGGMAAGVFTPNKAGFYLLSFGVLNSFSIGAGDTYIFTLENEVGTGLVSVQRQGADGVGEMSQAASVIVQGGPSNWYRVKGVRLVGAGAYTMDFGNGAFFSGSFLHG